MLSKNSEKVMENPSFIAEIERFRERLNSELCSSLSDSHKKLLSQIPSFISLALRIKFGIWPNPDDL